MIKLMRGMLRATQHTRNGRITEATRVIQRTLGLELKVRAQPEYQKALGLAVVKPCAEAFLTEAAQVITPTPRGLDSQKSCFAKHNFVYANEQYPYQLYVPAIDESGSTPFPVVVMLHGCKQDAADFAAGTAMNALAAEKKFIALYPEQRTKANGMRCWNWFDPAHQKRDRGEPGMIAALTREALANPANNADAKRVYICGLSAGGAMASVVANLYPELFAAVGVHSGLRSDAANDPVSAFKAMRSGTTRTSGSNNYSNAMPTIVFHGNADKTVNPVNGSDVVNAALNSLNGAGVVLDKIPTIEGSADVSPSERRARRTVYRAANGKSYVEHWNIEGGPHAWSGGSPAGSYTDPQGPNASWAMLEFFLQHHR